MPLLDRTNVLDRLHAADGPLIGAGVGSGFAATFAERGGADFVIVHNAGRFRNAGAGSLAGLLPFADANALTIEIAEEVVRAVDEIPVIAGVCGTDPLRPMAAVLEKLSAIGVAGVQNFPTVGVIDGAFRHHLEETGLGFEQEVDLIQQAAERGFVTAPYVFNDPQTEAVIKAGADMVVPHMGLTTKGKTGAQPPQRSMRPPSGSRPFTTRPSTSTPRSSWSPTAGRWQSRRTYRPFLTGPTVWTGFSGPPALNGCRRSWRSKNRRAG